jgi:hypothetical protein
LIFLRFVHRRFDAIQTSPLGAKLTPCGKTHVAKNRPQVLPKDECDRLFSPEELTKGGIPVFKLRKELPFGFKRDLSCVGNQVTGSEMKVQNCHASSERSCK